MYCVAPTRVQYGAHPGRPASERRRTREHLVPARRALERRHEHRGPDALAHQRRHDRPRGPLGALAHATLLDTSARTQPHERSFSTRALLVTSAVPHMFCTEWKRTLHFVSSSWILLAVGRSRTWTCDVFRERIKMFDKTELFCSESLCVLQKLLYSSPSLVVSSYSYTPLLWALLSIEYSIAQPEFLIRLNTVQYLFSMYCCC